MLLEGIKEESQLSKRTLVWIVNKLDVQIVYIIMCDLSMQGEPWCFYGVRPVKEECSDVNPKVDCGEL